MTDDRPYAVRPATPDDAPSLARAHRRAWHEAYDALMGAEAIDRQPVTELERGWRIRLEVDDPEAVVAVGISPSGEVLGFASAGPTRDVDSPIAWELYAVNIVATAYGTGLGHDLVTAVAGEREHTLWVLEENRRARAFYAKAGYLVEGARKLHEGSGLPEIRLIRRPLTTAPLVGDLVELRLATREECRAIAAGGPRSPAWAEGFPREDDVDGAPDPGPGGPDRWGSRLVVRRADGLVVGTAGFFGPPGADGEVEVGYGLVPAARRRGLLGEGLPLLVAGALAAGARSVRAHTDPGNVASRGLLRASGFVDLGVDGSGEVLHRWVRPD